MDHDTKHQVNHEFKRLPKGERRVRFADSMGMELVSIFLFDLISNYYFASIHSHQQLPPPPPSKAAAAAAASPPKTPIITKPQPQPLHQHHYLQAQQQQQQQQEPYRDAVTPKSPPSSPPVTSSLTTTTPLTAAAIATFKNYSGLTNGHSNSNRTSNDIKYNHTHSNIASNNYTNTISTTNTTNTTTTSNNNNNNSYYNYNSNNLSSQASTNDSSLDPSTYSCDFVQPISLVSFKERVKLNKVHLETCSVHSRPDVVSVSCTIRVLNLSYEKSVILRYTTDEWHTHTDCQAIYKPGSYDGWSDKFTSTFSIANPARKFQTSQRIMFAIKFIHNGDQTCWDNNGGLNYGLKNTR